MKKLFLLPVMFLIALTTFSQSDTIFTNNEKILCTVKEITPEAVKFTYPNEDLVNSMFKNTIQKIVFKSGRVQLFAENTSYKTVSGPKDFENVTITKVESEVHGLFKLGDVGAKAKGTTEFSNQERVKQRAYRKIKLQASMMHANIIFLTDARTQGNKWGSQWESSQSSEASFTGVAYTNVIPNFNDFVKTLGNKTRLQGIEVVELNSGGSDIDLSEFHKFLNVTRVYNENGLIMMDGSIEGVKKYNTFRVSGFTNDSFTIIFHDKDSMYSYRFSF